MIEIINEIFTLIAQLAVFVFSVGVVIFAFRFPIIREGAQKGLQKTALGQHDRLKNKIMRLFGLGTITIFYSIVGKIFINQAILNTCWLWFLLVAGLLLLTGCFFFFYQLLNEIW